jgi:23S rRNA pseudouridine1911/1915/1917 synthase
MLLLSKSWTWRYPKTLNRFHRTLFVKDVSKGITPLSSSNMQETLSEALLPSSMSWNGTPKGLKNLILFEDQNILVVYKPPTILSQQELGAKDNSSHLMSLLTDYLNTQPKRKETSNTFLGLVHRLDRPTSGIMLFAKTRQCLQILNKSIQDKRVVKKLYLCMVNGGLPQGEEGVWEDYLLPSHQQKTKCIPAPAKTPTTNTSTSTNTTLPKNAMYAKMRYRVLHNAIIVPPTAAVTTPSSGSVTKVQSLLEVELQTGRKHQIRAQCEAHGLSIVGDSKYGAPQSFQTRDIALHAYFLQFRHPITKSILTFTTPPPRIWTKRFPSLTMKSINTLLEEKKQQVLQNPSSDAPIGKTGKTTSSAKTFTIEPYQPPDQEDTAVSDAGPFSELRAAIARTRSESMMKIKNKEAELAEDNRLSRSRDRTGFGREGQWEDSRSSRTDRRGSHENDRDGRRHTGKNIPQHGRDNTARRSYSRDRNGYDTDENSRRRGNDYHRKDSSDDSFGFGGSNRRSQEREERKRADVGRRRTVSPPRSALNKFLK